MEGHVQEAAVKQKSFDDASKLLAAKGSIANSSIVISFPIDGSCLIIEQEDGLAY